MVLFDLQAGPGFRVLVDFGFFVGLEVGDALERFGLVELDVRLPRAAGLLGV